MLDIHTYIARILLPQSQKSFRGFVCVFLVNLMIIKTGGSVFFFFFYPRVNLKTTFPVHKSSFCVRILLPPELHALSSFSALLLTLLLIRFMGDKSGGASAKAAPTSSSCRHTKTHSIYIRTVSSTALISHKSYYEKSKKKSRERLLLFSTKTQSIYYGTVSS